MEIDNLKITGITCDSRKVKKGYAFVAIKGTKEDGNQYLDEAISNGAIIVYTEMDINNKYIPVKKVDNARAKLSELLNTFYGYPSEKLSLIGVTGTNGKTTTTHLIKKIFDVAGYKTGLIGTLGIKVSDEHISSSLTTPEPEILFEKLNDFVNNGVKVVLMEVSSHGLKFYRTHGLKFEVAVHTNIEKDHMNLHKNFNDYVKTKKMLFDSLGRNKLAIINIDDDNGVKLIEGNNKVIALTYGLNSKASITASSMIIDNRIKFNYCLQRGLTTIQGLEIEPLEFPVDINLIGKHNVYNILAAVAVALYFGIEIEIIQRSLKFFEGIHRRLEKIYKNDFTVIDDYSHNPTSYQAVLETVQSLKYNKLVIVNSIRGNRGIQVNKDNANTIASLIPLLGEVKIILTLSKDVVGVKDKVSEEELLAYKKIFDKRNIQYVIYETLRDSIKKSIEMARKDDIILLFGAQGMDKGREILNELLKKNDKKN